MFIKKTFFSYFFARAILFFYFPRVLSAYFCLPPKTAIFY